MKSTDKVMLSLGAVTVITATGVGACAATDTTEDAKVTTTTTVAEAPSDNDTNTYKDGTYTATESYALPSHTNKITTTITVKDGQIAKLETTHEAPKDSQSFLDAFSKALEGQIVGKPLDSAVPAQVAGSTITTEAFVKTLDTIRSEAAK